MKIIKANTTDGNVLTALTLESKAHWGYTVDQIENWTDDLTINATYIDKNQVYKLVNDDKLVGFYAFLPESNTKVELNFMFVDSAYIGKGYGKILMNDFLERVKALQYKTVTLIADPNAELFYKRAGFNVLEKLESLVEGRFLPVMEKEII